MSRKHLLIVFHSRSGSTRRMADAVVSGKPCAMFVRAGLEAGVF